MTFKNLLTISISYLLVIFLVSCGGDDPAPQIQPKAEGNDLEKILHSMNKAAQGHIAAATQVGEDGEGLDSLLQLALSGVSTKYNEYRMTADRICHSGEGGIGVDRQTCENKFWHFLISQKGSQFAAALPMQDPLKQAQAIQLGLQIFQNLGVNPPQDYLAGIQSQIQGIKTQLADGGLVTNDLGLTSVGGAVRGIASSPEIVVLPDKE